MCDKETLYESPYYGLSFFKIKGDNMIEKAMYFGKSEIYQKIKDAGGVWNDSKERPVVCLIESTEYKGLFWAIPVGNWDHRDENAQKRIKKYMDYPNHDLRSCYYHIGKTTNKSIFFISDVIPITDRYTDREYKGFNDKTYVIKNPNLIQALTEKLTRILVFESKNNNYFRQHITDIKHLLISELIQQSYVEEVAASENPKNL